MSTRKISLVEMTDRVASKYARELAEQPHDIVERVLRESAPVIEEMLEKEFQVEREQAHSLTAKIILRILRHIEDHRTLHGPDASGG